MCFSAQASFLAGAGLSGMGIYLLNSPHKKEERYFFSIPLMFGIQQTFEGFVWVTQTMPDMGFYNTIARYGFLFFAFVVWPVWVPFSLLKMEKKEAKKRCLSAILGAGTVIATSLAWVSLAVGVTSLISCNHIEYVLDLPSAIGWPGAIWYCIATLSPFFVSNKKWMKEFGILLTASALVSAYFYSAWFTSVWCFFAAVLSLMIYKIKQA